MNLRLVEPFALAHHGLVTLDAVRQAGLSKSTWNRAVIDGQLELVHPGVARIVGSARTRHQLVAAAVLAAGKGAVASHRTAAGLWGIERPPDDPLELILPERTRQATLRGVIVHRPRDQLDLGAVFRFSIPTSKLLRMLCDLGAVDRGGVHAAVGHVVTHGLASPNSLATAVGMHSRRGRPGVPAFREALDDWLVEGKCLDSELERRMKNLVKRAGLPPIEFHPAPILGYEVDFHVTGTPIVLECDGWEFHDKRRAKFERDRRQDAELTAAGYITVRFTWTMLTRQPQWVASMIGNAVRRWSRAPAESNLGGVRLATS